MAKGFVEHFDGRLRSHFTGLRAADAIRHRKDRTLAIVQERVFVQRPPLVEPAVRQCSGLHLEGFSVFAHSTASSLRGEELLATGLSSMTRSRALRFENAINMPSIAKLVIKLKPPWLTNGS